MGPKILLAGAALIAAFWAGAWLERLDYEREALSLSRQLENCGYTPHGIADIAWEIYARGKAPLGSALYFTRMTNSKNILAADCMEELFNG